MGQIPRLSLLPSDLLLVSPLVEAGHKPEGTAAAKPAPGGREPEGQAGDASRR